MKKHFFHIAIMVSCFAAHAQDPHFSQYANLPLYVNPANTGSAIEHVRLTAVYRNQWSGISSPYTTQGFFVDKKVGRFGFGMQIVKNGAGEASIQRLDLAGMMAYHLQLGRNGELSGAMQVGMMNKKFNPDNLSFDNQYVEDTGFDPLLPHGEVFSNTSITRPDLTMGLLYKYGFDNHKIKFKPFGGVSFAHINRPDEVFITGDYRMPIRQTYHAGAGILLKENIELRPLAVFMIQENFNELFAGGTVSFLLQNTNKFQAGLFLRKKDAAVAYVGYQVNRLFIGTSYDFNISSLNEVSRGHGGFELTLSYVPRKKQKGKPTDPAEIIAKVPEKKEKKVAHLEKKDSDKLAVVAHAPETLAGRNGELPVLPEKSGERADPQPRAATKTGTKQAHSEKTVAQHEEKTPRTEPVESMTRVPDIDAESLAMQNPAPERLKIDRPTEAIPLPEIEESVPPIDKMDRKRESLHPVMEDEPAPQTKPVMANTEMFIDNTPVLKTLVDTDGDGINDAQDECPYIKGHVSTNGCPDADRDGVVDMKDRCPMEPGTVSNRGCPETEPAYANANLIRNFNHIEFETGRAVIRTTDLYDIVEFAIDILYANPESRIILTGHTDSEGNELFNMKLSSLRTGVVNRYLQRQGIAPGRIQVINYGERMPLMDNSDAYGKARNRRVEINIVRN